VIDYHLIAIVGSVVTEMSLYCGGLGDRSGYRGIGEPVSATGVVFVEFGFERYALFIVNFFADGYDIAEVLRHSYPLLAAGYRITVAIKGAFEGTDLVDTMRRLS
jgi:hypothetical protein